MRMVKCDNCGRLQQVNAYDRNPINPETNTQWFSRQENGVEFNACSRECRDKLPGIPAPF